MPITNGEMMQCVFNNLVSYESSILMTGHYHDTQVPGRIMDFKQTSIWKKKCKRDD